MLKQLYRRILRDTEFIPQRIELIKTNIAESLAIAHKKNMYSSVSWTEEQQRAFDDYWVRNYGKRISNKWHRLYQAVSGKYCIDYIPEKLYTTSIEPFLNDRRYAVALEDKFMVEILAKDCGCVVPETILVCSAGRFYNGSRMPITEAAAVTVLSKECNYIVKPTVGSSSGMGIVFCDSPIFAEQISRNIHNYGKDYIVQRRIYAHPSFARFNPDSINTIRITTYILNGKIYHFPLAFRIGRSGKQVDNIHAGGLVIGVQDTGLLCPLAFELGYGDKGKCFEEHPDSKVIFKGYQLPNVNAIIESATKIHGKLPHIGIVSWDFTIDRDCNPVLIEANIVGQSIWISQMIWGKGAFEEHTREILYEISKKTRRTTSGKT